MSQQPLSQRTSRKREPGNNQDDDDHDEHDDHDEDEFHSNGQSDHENDDDQYNESHPNSQGKNHQHSNNQNQNGNQNTNNRYHGNQRRNQRYSRNNQRYNNRPRYEQNQSDKKNRPENYHEYEPKQYQQNRAPKKNVNEKQFQSFEETAVQLLDPVVSNDKQFAKAVYGHNSDPNHQPKVEFDRSSLISPNQQRSSTPGSVSITNDIPVPKELENWILSEQGETFTIDVQQSNHIDVIQVVRSTYGNKNTVQIRLTCANENIFNRARSQIEHQFASLLHHDMERNRNIPNEDHHYHDEINNSRDQPFSNNRQPRNENFQKSNRNFQQRPKPRSTLRDIRMGHEDTQKY